jgi:hypothetical protein
MFLHVDLSPRRVTKASLVRLYSISLLFVILQTQQKLNNAFGRAGALHAHAVSERREKQRLLGDAHTYIFLVALA